MLALISLVLSIIIVLIRKIRTISITCGLKA